MINFEKTKHKSLHNNKIVMAKNRYELKIHKSTSSNSKPTKQKQLRYNYTETKTDIHAIKNQLKTLILIIQKLLYRFLK